MVLEDPPVAARKGPKPEAHTRITLLETALDLIWEQSYGAVSVNDICARAGVNKGSFYHFFASKSELAVAAFEYHWEVSCARWDRIFSVQVPPLERIRRYARAVYDIQRERFHKAGKVCGCPYGSVGSEQSTQDERIREVSQRIFDRHTRYLETALRDAAAEGIIPGQDFHALAREMFAYVLGMLLQAKISNDLELIKVLDPGVLRLVPGMPEAALRREGSTA